MNGSEKSISLEDWVKELSPDIDGDLILQMDIEGAERRNLLKTPEHILRRFRIIVIELHGLQVCNRPSEFMKELGPLLTFLDKHFFCVHAHPNNCCGEVVLVGTNLNIPNVVELTFLRRGRWDGVSKEECHPPLLPHPIDIAANVQNKPPLYLNEQWLVSGERAPESTIKMLTDKVNYLTRELESNNLQIVTDLHRLAMHMASELPDLHAKPAIGDLIDLAQGKQFTLSSKHLVCPKNNLVIAKRPFFFHTGYGRNQFITIDLGAEHKLFELIITNRYDTCKERARLLFYCTHNQPSPCLLNGLPVSVDESFLGKGDQVSITNLRGCKGRYFTIFSPAATFLHFLSIKIMGSSSKGEIVNL